MAWTPLAKRLDDLPVVLAGPILRKVLPTSVTVWVALQRRANVTLRVISPAGNDQLTGSRTTVAVGEKLHIVAVTADKLQPSMPPLQEGNVYRYEMEFDFLDPEGGRSPSLAQATTSPAKPTGALLTYPSFDRPSFCLPPSDVNNLRLIQGSCRLPVGNGPDTLSFVDDLIEQAASNPSKRPHQLFMTGDQIYADDVAVCMLLMLTDAAATLLGWKEVLPFPDSHGGPNTPEKKPPFLRRWLLDEIGLTSVDLDGHLLSVGEYLCMYLFVWSDTLWEADAVPSFDELVATVKTNTEPGHFASFVKVATKKQPTVRRERVNLIRFRSGLELVRRALANIPSYMIFDDHEVTDDWNMTQTIAQQVSSTKLGVRMEQNALVAYALCQHWGNVPDDFRQGGPTTPPGLALLGLLDNANATSYEANSAAIADLVGVRDAATLRRHPGAFAYNYTVEAPGHQVIVTDTRSWRTFPKDNAPAPDLLPPDQIQKQIVATDDTEGRLLLIVLSTNAPPVRAIRTATQMAGVANRFAKVPDLYESWEIPSAAMDRLLKAISIKLKVSTNQSRGSALLLSGDVHFSFASRLRFSGTSRFEDALGSSHAVDMVIAQLVASSFRKETGDTVAFHRQGYDWGPGAKAIIIPPTVREEFAGWNLAPGQKLEIGDRIVTRRNRSGESLTQHVPYAIDRSGTKPLAIWSRTSSPEFIKLTAVPHWSYRLEYINPHKEAPLPLNLPPVPPLPPTADAAARKKAAKAFHVATGNYRIYDKSRSTKREVVGVNNFGEMTFDWGSVKRVNHTVRWLPAGTDRPVFTTYTVNLDPTDPPVQP